MKYSLWQSGWRWLWLAPLVIVLDQLSKLADEKGGKYYVITAAREHGPNFEATAEVYK